MAGKPKEAKDVSETNEDQDPEEMMMIPGTSGTSTTKTKTKKGAKKKSAGKQPKKPKKSDEQQGKKQTKITEYLASKTEQPEEKIPADKPESRQDDQDEDEDLIKNSGITKKSKKMKNIKKKSRRILASSDEEEEDSSSQNAHNRSINEFDRIQQQLAQIEMLRVEFSKGPDISEVIGKRAQADDPEQNQSQHSKNVPDPDSDSDSEIDLKQYFFKKSQFKRIRSSLRTIAPKPPAAAECTKNDFLQLFILLDNVPATGNPNPNQNPQDPFNIGQMLFDEKIIDYRTMMLLNLWKCCSAFMKLIETFNENALEDGVLKIRRSEKEPSPEDHHRHHRYVNDAQILQQYVNLYALNAKKLMINDAATAAAENPESSGSRGGSRSAPLFVYCLLAQEICLKTLKQQKKNRKHDDDRRSRFIIDLLTTFPTIPDYASTTTTTMMMVLSGNDNDPNDNQIKRNKCCWLLQLSAILIIGLFDCFQSFHLDLDKFFQQLDLIITLQSRMLDCCLINQVESGVVPKVLDHHLDRPSHHHNDDPLDEDDGQVDDHNDEYDQTLSLYLFLLYICLSLKTLYHARDKFGLAEAEASSDPSGSINSVQRSFMVYDHLRSMFGKLFQTFTGGGHNTKSVFRKFYRLVFRWHRLDNNNIGMFQMDHPNILKSSSSSSSSSREDRLCIQLIIIIETFSQLMLFLPKWLSKTGEHLHLFWMLFTLIKLKCLKPEDSGSGQESSPESDAADGAEPPICRTFEQAIQPMIDIVWRELPFGCQIYLVHFISAYITNFGTNPFILNLCKTLFNIPGMDFKFRSMISALSMDI